MLAMTYGEFQRQLGKAGLSAREFADLIRMNRNSITNCSQKGKVPSHLAIIAALMGEMAENHLDFKSVLAKVDIEPKKSRGGAFKGKFGDSKRPDKFVRSGKKDGEPL